MLELIFDPLNYWYSLALAHGSGVQTVSQFQTQSLTGVSICHRYSWRGSGKHTLVVTMESTNHPRENGANRQTMTLTYYALHGQLPCYTTPSNGIASVLRHHSEYLQAWDGTYMKQ